MKWKKKYNHTALKIINCNVILAAAIVPLLFFMFALAAAVSSIIRSIAAIVKRSIMLLKYILLNLN